MDWPEIIIEGFPGPRDGEPPDLRGDITDELNDHLACAMQRELRRTDDPAVAEHAVLDRFGDPKRIARRLWWDAMKEQIMKDRVMIGMMVLTLLICAAVGFFAWQMVQQGQQVNQAILARLETLGKPVAQPAVPGDWAKVTFRCYEGEGRDKPVSDRRIVLEGKPFNDVEKEVLHQSTDDQGLTTFGPFRPGRYEWGISSSGYYSDLRSELILYPGQALEKIVNVPPADSQTDVAITVNWPDELQNKDVLVCCRFEGAARLGDTYWSVPERTVATATDGKVRIGYGSGTVVWPPEAPRPGARMPGRPPSERRGVPSVVPAPFSLRQPPARGNRLALFSLQEESIQTEEHFRCPAARYHLRSIHVMTRATDPQDANLRWLEYAKVEYRSHPQPTFEALLGQSNTWSIDLPEDLIKQVREYLPQAEPLDMLTDIQLRVAWPEDLAKQGFPLLCKFVPAPTASEETFVNQWWSTNEWTPFVRADGNLVWGYECKPPSPPRPSVPGAPGTDARQSDLNVIQPERVKLQEEPRTRRPAATYRLAAISVLAPTEDLRNREVKWHRIAAASFDDSPEPPAFVAEKGKLNVWTIRLPDDLLKEVREYVVRQSQLGDTMADIQMRVDWPSELANRKLPVYCSFVPAESPPKTGRGEPPPIEKWQAVILADGSILKDYICTTLPAQEPDGVVIEAREAGEPKREPHTRRPAATYVLAEACILSPVNKPTEPSKWQSFAEWRSGSPAGADCTFVAEPGRLNTWTIKIPQELLWALGKPPSQIHSAKEPASAPAELGPRPRAPVGRESDIRRDRRRM